MCIAMPMGVLPRARTPSGSPIAFAWGWLGTIVIILMPLWENSKSIMWCHVQVHVGPDHTAEPAKASESA